MKIARSFRYQDEISLHVQNNQCRYLCVPVGRALPFSYPACTRGSPGVGPRLRVALPVTQLSSKVYVLSGEQAAGELGEEAQALQAQPPPTRSGSWQRLASITSEGRHNVDRNSGCSRLRAGDVLERAFEVPRTVLEDHVLDKQVVVPYHAHTHVQFLV